MCFRHAILAATLLSYMAVSVGVASPLPKWSYAGLNNGEENWPGVTRDYLICEDGTQQSPIIIAYTTPLKMPALIMHYTVGKASIENKDYTLVITPKSANTLKDGDHTYRLMEIRLHTPAEHHILGHVLPLEFQLIHKDAKGKILILSVLADLGSDNTGFQPIIDSLTSKKDLIDFDPSKLLPEKQGYYAYTGSLTTPPCTEGIEWRIFKYSIEISQEQQKILGKAIGRNTRLPQPVYMRTIKETAD